MNKIIYFILIISLISCDVLPSPSHIRWQKHEIGAFSHFGMQTFVGDMCSKLSSNGNLKFSLPDPDTYNPELIDTDQWARTAKSFGAKYLMMVAQHCDGFSQWPTSASVDGIEYKYSVKSSKWRNGTGDLVGDFIKSCQKYDLLPGIYYQLNINYYANAFQGIVKKTSKDPLQLVLTQSQFDSLVLQQLSELWHNYGELSEIWFDGGYSSTIKQGIIDIIAKYAPNSVAFQGPTEVNGIRWIGNERGVAPYPNWSRANSNLVSGGGNPEGIVWAPGECDTTLSNTDWFWTPDHEQRGIKSLSTLVSIYHTSTGRNCNLLLNMNPDTRGLVPEKDIERYQEFGSYIEKCYSTPISSTKGKGLYQIDLLLDKEVEFNRIVLMENNVNGENIRKFNIKINKDGEYVNIYDGQSIGHKLIILLDTPVVSNKVRLSITESSAGSVLEINDFSIYSCEVI